MAGCCGGNTENATTYHSPVLFSGIDGGMCHLLSVLYLCRTYFYRLSDFALFFISNYSESNRYSYLSLPLRSLRYFIKGKREMPFLRSSQSVDFL